MYVPDYFLIWYVFQFAGIQFQDLNISLQWNEGAAWQCECLYVYRVSIFAISFQESILAEMFHACKLVVTCRGRKFSPVPQSLEVSSLGGDTTLRSATQSPTRSWQIASASKHIFGIYFRLAEPLFCRIYSVRNQVEMFLNTSIIVIYTIKQAIKRWCFF